MSRQSDPSLFPGGLLRWVSMGIGAFVVIFIASIYSFLAISHPQGKGILVVEAWIPQKTLEAVVPVFHSGNYQSLFIVGGPIQGTSDMPGHPVTFADRAESALLRLGIDRKQLIKINVPPVSQERTLTGAAAAKVLLERSGTRVCCVDVFTVGVHARKSWILSQYAFGTRYRVGVIAGPESSFDARLWFVSKRGIRIVLRNLAGYMYYKFWILSGGKESPTLFSFIAIPHRPSKASSLLPDGHCDLAYCPSRFALAVGLRDMLQLIDVTYDGLQLSVLNVRRKNL